MVHNETTTGITSDVAKVRQAMDGVSHPALLLIDGVSSIGALDFQFDKWKVDVAMTGSQKALSLPTGLAVLAVSQKVGSVMGSWCQAAAQAWLLLKHGCCCYCHRASHAGGVQ